MMYPSSSTRLTRSSTGNTNKFAQTTQSANDSDVFVLGTYAWALDRARQWHFNYQTDCHSNLGKVADILGDAALYLPQFHALTGCDSTAFSYFRGKTKPWECAVKASGDLSLIRKL